ncbi:MAG: hypothetical protein IAF58_09340 [Leptolyngbya sp.]|nr:hypothetical protein [Candidatus Melainabacteria bacterium]
MEEIVALTLAKDPDQRYQNFVDLARDLATLQEVKARETSTSSFTVSKALGQIQKTSKKQYDLRIITTACAMVALLFLSIGYYIGFVTAPPQIVVRKVDNAFITPQISSREVGIEPYVSLQKNAAGELIRIYRFPSTYSLGKFSYQGKDGKNFVTDAKGAVEVPAYAITTLTSTSDELVEHAYGLRGFGPKDLNRLCLINDTDGLNVILSPENCFDDALLHAARIKELQELNVCNTPTTDIGLRCLRDSIYLRNLNVSDTEVTAEAVVELKAFPNLIALYVRGVKDGKTLIPQFLKQKSLVYLEAGKIGLTDEDIRKISVLPKLSALDVRDSPEITNKSLDYLSKISALSVSGTSINPAAIDKLVLLKNLKQLTVGRNLWPLKDMRRLQALRPDLTLNAFYIGKGNRLSLWDWKNEK